MITRRDVFVAIIVSVAMLCMVAVADQQGPIMHSAVFDWNDVPAKQTDVGSVREFFESPTATLDALELHVTTLNPGQASHPPHQHPNEEMVIVKEGTVEVFSNGEWRKVGPGSVVFNASNQMHGIRNAGTGPATYHVINWKSSATPK